MMQNGMDSQIQEHVLSVLLKVIAVIDRIEIARLGGLDWIGRRYRRILKTCAERLDISYPGPGPINANSTCLEAAAYLVKLAESQATSSEVAIVPTMPSKKSEKRNWRTVQHLIMQKLSERCGLRVVDLSLTTTLGLHARNIDLAVGNALGFGALRGFTPKTSIGVAIELTLKQQAKVRMKIGTTSSSTPEHDWETTKRDMAYRDRVLGVRN